MISGSSRDNHEVAGLEFPPLEKGGKGGFVESLPAAGIRALGKTLLSDTEKPPGLTHAS